MLKVSELTGGNVRLIDLNNVNIVLGRNGAGKSRFMRQIEQQQRHVKESQIRYVSPERAGSFQKDGNVITQASNNENYLPQQRSKNQASQFKQASAMLLEQVENNYLRRLQGDNKIRLDLSRNFQIDRIDRINSLLTNVRMDFGTSGFEFRSSETDEVVAADQLSSGESEGIALASEVLHFFDTLNDKALNVLMLDEPDVHLHPDMQARFAHFVLGMFEEFKDEANNVAICIATHSTPLVCAFAQSSRVSIGTKFVGVESVQLNPVNQELVKLAPFFGHPLSMAMSQDPIFIVEGEDDERVWQQAARSSQGKIRVFPILAETVDKQTDLEKACVRLLKAIYDEPLAFSLRDGDGKSEPLEHSEPMRRYRLCCYAIENLLMTDECLSVMDSSWAEFQKAAQSWMTKEPDHRDIKTIKALVSSSDRFKHTKIKEIRNLIPSILDTQKPWEVIVGQAISKIVPDDLENGSQIVEYIGEDAVRDIVLR